MSGAGCMSSTRCRMDSEEDVCVFLLCFCVFLPRTVVVFVAAFAILLSCYTIESADALDAAVWPRNLGFALL